MRVHAHTAHTTYAVVHGPNMVTKNRGIYRLLCISWALIAVVPRKSDMSY